jgi:hypothetical protein
MSSQPHTVLPWVVRRTRLPLLSLWCVGCRSESATAGEGRFRVNANRNLLDVWLLVRCVSCDRTSKLTVHERASARSFNPVELDGYHANDPELVASRLLDPLLARRNHFSLDWTGAWRLDTPSALLDEAWPVQVEVGFEAPVPVRPERLIARGLDLSRNEVRRRIKCAIPLRRTTSAGFTFIVMPRAYQQDVAAAPDPLRRPREIRLGQRRLRRHGVAQGGHGVRGTGRRGQIAGSGTITRP